MAFNSYPNITLSATNTVIGPHFNGSIVTSTYGSSISLTVTTILPAGFSFWAIQTDAGAIWVTAGSGAAVNGRGGLVATNGQYAAIKVMATNDGSAIVTGDIA